MKSVKLRMHRKLSIIYGVTKPILVITDVRIPDVSGDRHSRVRRFQKKQFLQVKASTVIIKNRADLENLLAS